MATAKLRRDVRTPAVPTAKGLPSSKALPPLPSVLDLGRHIVRLSNTSEELDRARIELKRQQLDGRDECRRDRHLKEIKGRSFERECLLVDVALGMRAHTLGDVAVMLGLAWRVLDLEAHSEFDEESFQKAAKQIQHALLTSLDVVAKEAGIDLAETIGPQTQGFIDREHADLGDGL
jgi:hypothetical protein